MIHTYEQIHTALPLANEWFLGSGIQDPEGGVARYYLTEPRRNARISTEITGYAISALVYLHRRLDDFRCLEAARSAASFLVRRAWDPALEVFPFEYPGNLAYFFDSGIIARGLLTLWRVMPEVEWLDAAVAAGRSMLRHFVRGSSIHPIIELPSCRPRPNGGSWSQSPGCYQLKAALAWHDLFEVTRDSDFLEAYEMVLSRSVATHEDFLPGDVDPHRVMDRLHAYCYFLEGMLPRYSDPACAEAVRDGIAKVAAFLRDIAPSFERSDVSAQLIRVRLYADRLGVAPLDREAALEELAFLVKFQREDPDPARSGGFWFGAKGGDLLPYVNPVSTAFGLQAVDMWRRAEADEFTANRHELI